MIMDAEVNFYVIGFIWTISWRGAYSPIKNILVCLFLINYISRKFKLLKYLYSFLKYCYKIFVRFSRTGLISFKFTKYADRHIFLLAKKKAK